MLWKIVRVLRRLLKNRGLIVKHVLNVSLYSHQIYDMIRHCCDFIIINLKKTRLAKLDITGDHWAPLLIRKFLTRCRSLYDILENTTTK